MPRLRLCLLAVLLWLPQAQAADRPGRIVAAGQNGLLVIAVAELPAEARDTLRLIKQRGPFPFDRDGVVFMNYERVLPSQARGYYREYTVKTPGVLNRGGRRIVCGPLPEEYSGKGSEHRTTQRYARTTTLSEFPECYYSADHYQSFKRIREQS